MALQNTTAIRVRIKLCSQPASDRDQKSKSVDQPGVPTDGQAGAAAMAV
jgi:hypothetical protein